MTNRGIIYELRRKLQVFLTRNTSYEFMSKVFYFVQLKRRLDLENPTDLNEKIQWLSLNYLPYNKEVIRCTDKYLVRDYLKERGLGHYLNELIGAWDRWEDLEWEDLPEEFALKCNHGARYNIITDNKKKLSEEKTAETVKKWLDEDFSLFNAEKHYSLIEPKIICEKFLGGDMKDYKIFCFNGEPEFLYVSFGETNGRSEYMDYYYPDGTLAPFFREGYKQTKSQANLPENLSEMLEASRILSSEFPFVRVDFFEVNNRIYFSEMTFTPGGGFMMIEPREYLRKWGKLINVSDVEKGMQ